MQTFLIASTSENFIDREIEKLKKRVKVNDFNIHLFQPENSIGIAEVRKIIGLVSLKPFDGGERLIVIQNMEKATLESQNALLKLLEEPPPGNYIVMTVDNPHRLAPTIISRCQIISENEYRSTPETKESLEIIQLIKKIVNAPTGERILISQKTVNTRDEALKLLNTFLTTLEFLLHQPDKNIGLTIQEIATLISKIAAAKNYVEKYISFKATLDILFLGFPKVDRNTTNTS